MYHYACNIQKKHVLLFEMEKASEYLGNVSSLLISIYKQITISYLQAFHGHTEM